MRLFRLPSFVKSKNKVDVFIQDQTTPPVEHFMFEILNNVTIASNASLGDNQLTMESGHGFIDPVPPAEDFIVIYYIDESQPTAALKYRFFQSRVVNVTDDVIDLGIHLPFDLDITKVDSAHRVNVNMAVSGTFASPKKFHTTPVNGVEWDLTRVVPDMILSSLADDGLFGNITALINGMFFGFEGDNFTEYNVNVIDNGGFRSTAFDVLYTTRSGGQGSFGMSVRKTFAGQDKYGVTIRLDGTTHDMFVAYIQDNLTGLARFRMKVMGHVVD